MTVTAPVVGAVPVLETLIVKYAATMPGVTCDGACPTATVNLAPWSAVTPDLVAGAAGTTAGKDMRMATAPARAATQVLIIPTPIAGTPRRATVSL
ncbi:MAG TPA: hypothetical protein VEO01_25745 [Pseudonocardiaceae bacterium]|nr:hypothetical protein [Pseudonocardiaceae bacterium]